MLTKLQAELVKLQFWGRIVVIFRWPDAAGKGGMIKAITERVSPRVFRTVALAAPTERQKTQVYFQRYVEHFPAGGEIVIPVERSSSLIAAGRTAWASNT